MRKAFDNHTLLAGGSSRGSLWLAPDHLLVIENNSFFLPYRERYRRFDYDSIQGVFVARTEAGRWATVVLALATVLCGLPALLQIPPKGSWGTVAFFGAVTVILLALLGAHLVKGPTARCSIQTAVQAYRLGPVRRWKEARRVVDLLREKCEAAQGGPLEIGPEAAPMFPSPSPPPRVQSHSMAPPPIPENGPTAARPEPVLWKPHPTAIPAYLSVAGAGGAFLGEIAVDSVAYTSMMIAVGCIAFALLAVAASRGKGPRWNGGSLVWGLNIGTLLLDGFLAYGVCIAGMVAETTARGPSMKIQGTYDMVLALARFPEGAPDALASAFGICAALTALAGIIGAVAVRRQQHRLARLAEAQGQRSEP